MHILRTIKGARVSIVPEMKIIQVCVRKRNAYLCIDLFFLENGLAVVRWRSGKIAMSAFINHRIRVNRLASYLH